MRDYLNPDVVRTTPLSCEPYRFAIWRDAVPRAMAYRLTQEYPTDGFVRNERTTGGDKTYSFLVRKAVEKNVRLPSFDSLSPAWQEFIDALTGRAYRSTIGELIGEHIDDYEMDIGFFVFTEGNATSVHTDHLTKATTNVLYFGRRWLPEWGGQLGLYRRHVDGSFEMFDQILPQTGYGLLLIPSSESWHGVSAVSAAAEAPRLTLQIETWRPGGVLV